MGTQTLQTVLCRAAVDGSFLATLLSAPRRALQAYALSPAEVDVLIQEPANSLANLAANVEAWRRGEPRRIASRELAFAG